MRKTVRVQVISRKSAPVFSRLLLTNATEKREKCAKKPFCANHPAWRGVFSQRGKDLSHGLSPWAESVSKRRCLVYLLQGLVYLLQALE